MEEDILLLILLVILIFFVVAQLPKLFNLFKNTNEQSVAQPQIRKVAEYEPVSTPVQVASVPVKKEVKVPRKKAAPSAKRTGVKTTTKKVNKTNKKTPQKRAPK